MLGFGSNVTSSLESLYMKRQGLEPARSELAAGTPTALTSTRARD
jgi:hypothetical protein